MKPTIDKIKILIANNSTEEAIDKMLDAAEIANTPKLKDEIILQSSRLNQANRNRRFGIETSDRNDLVRNNINFALLETLKEFERIEEVTTNKQTPFSEKEREEIREFLLLFERAVFDAPVSSEEPTAMFKSIQDVRLSLQIKGAGLIKNQEAADIFREIRKILLHIEDEVIRKYPEVVAILDEVKNMPLSYERRKYVEEKLGRKTNWEAVMLMIGTRNDVMPRVEKVREIYRRLTN